MKKVFDFFKNIGNKIASPVKHHAENKKIVQTAHVINGDNKQKEVSKQDLTYRCYGKVCPVCKNRRTRFVKHYNVCVSCMKTIVRRGQAQMKQKIDAIKNMPKEGGKNV